MAPAKATQSWLDGAPAWRFGGLDAVRPKSAALEPKRLLTPKEVGIMQIAAQIPNKIPTDSQSGVLLEIMRRSLVMGFTVPEIGLSGIEVEEG